MGSRNYLLVLSFIVALGGVQFSFAGVCDPDPSITPSQSDRLHYYAAHGSCMPGTVVKYAAPTSSHVTPDGKSIPNLCFAMDYPKDKPGRAIPESCDPSTDKCTPLLRDGLSFNISDLQTQENAPDEDPGSLMHRIYEGLHLHTVVKVGEKVAQYGMVAFPLGDGITAFLGDMGQRADDLENDKEKAKAAAAAAAQMRSMLKQMLGYTDPASYKSTGCTDSFTGHYDGGEGVKNGLNQIFLSLAADKHFDMGLDSGPALSSGEQEKLDTLLAKVRMTRPQLKIETIKLSSTIPLEVMPPFSFDGLALKDTGPETGGGGAATTTTSGAAK